VASTAKLCTTTSSGSNSSLSIASKKSDAVVDLDARPYEDASYWEGRYGRRSKEDETDEWGFEYADLEPLLTPLKPQRQDGLIVDLGCGVSQLLIDMASQGWDRFDLLGVDLSANAVKTMQSRVRSLNLRANIKFETLDLCKLAERFRPNSVDLYMDKMTMDAILHASKGETMVRKIFRQIASTLRVGGSFVLVSQMNPETNTDFLELVAEALQEGCQHKANWLINVHVAEDSGVGLNVYMFKKNPRHQMSRRSGNQTSRVTLKIHEY